RFVVQNRSSKAWKRFTVVEKLRWQSVEWSSGSYSRSGDSSVDCLRYPISLDIPDDNSSQNKTGIIEVLSPSLDCGEAR
ncbi:Hypothetical protein FKW44_015310, partial [Caligus rogercresseyi]